MKEKAINKFKIAIMPIIGKKHIDFISKAFKTLQNFGLLDLTGCFFRISAFDCFIMFSSI